MLPNRVNGQLLVRTMLICLGLFLQNELLFQLFIQTMVGVRGSMPFAHEFPQGMEKQALILAKSVLAGSRHITLWHFDASPVS